MLQNEAGDFLKKLSIITITYKDAIGLQKTLASLQPLLNSSLSWEHIVVDSSPELNVDVFRSFPAPWPLSHIQTQPEGIYAAMNAGLKQANGEYIWFLNGGDELQSMSGLQDMLTTLDNDPELSGVYGGALATSEGKAYKNILPSGSFEKYLVGMNRVCHQGVIYRHSLFDKMGPYLKQFKLAADYEFNLRAVLSGARFKCLPKIFVSYDTGGASSNYKKAMEEFKQVHVHLSKNMALHQTLSQGLFWRFYEAKITLIKALGMRKLRVLFYKKQL